VQQVRQCIRQGDSGHSRAVPQTGAKRAERRGTVTGLTGAAA